MIIYINFVNERETLISEDKYNDSIEGLKNDNPVETEKLEEALKIYISENELRLLKAEFPDKWNYLSEKISLSFRIL